MLLSAVLQVAIAGTPAGRLAELEFQAAQQSGAPFSASPLRGEALFNRRTRDWSCASCHTTDPRNAGSHIVTGKAIKPMAPAANAERFADPAKTDKWFRRNCQDVLGRLCSSGEQADVLAYLMSLKL